MKKPTDKNQPPRAVATTRPVLRLVPPPEQASNKATAPAVPASPAATAAPGKKTSPLVQFMNAYADAIDEQIRVIMES